MPQIVEFVPANGFVAESYKTFFSAFSSNYKVQYLSRYGHAAAARGALRNWEGPTQELIDHLKSTTRPREQVIGLGHSMGGVLLLQAYARAPEKFSHLCIIDAPIFHPIKQWSISCAQFLGIAGYSLVAARKSKKRRAHWPSLEAMRAYLLARPFFQKFSPDALNDYLRYGVEKTTHGVSLRFSPAVEYGLFKSIPPFFRKVHPSVPTYYLYSAQYSLLKRVDIRFLMRNIVGATFVAFPGGHLYPFEDPSAAAFLVESLVSREGT